MSDYFLLLQINDALFPIGSYTQSYGLETYVQKNIITDAQTFSDFLKRYLHLNLVYNDLLAVKLAYQTAIDNKLSAINSLEEIISVTKVARELREASVKIGSRFIKNIMALSLQMRHSIFETYASEVTSKKMCGHHAVAYGVLCGALELNLAQSLQSYLYAQISGMLNTGVKLIPLSQTVGQVLLAELHVEFERALSKLNALSITDLGRSSPGFELRAMQHEHLYSRLYMS